MRADTGALRVRGYGTDAPDLDGQTGADTADRKPYQLVMAGG
jgi:hypothetical protein